MPKYTKLICILAAVLFAGGSYHHIHELSIPANHPPEKLLSQQSHIRKALNYIGNKDSGKAFVKYNRADHVLKFSILYMNDIKLFIGKRGRKQKKLFERISGVHNVVIQCDTLTAVKRRDIELRENYEQKIENQAEKNQLAAQASKAKLAKEEANKKATIASLSKKGHRGNQIKHHFRSMKHVHIQKRGHHKV